MNQTETIKKSRHEQGARKGGWIAELDFLRGFAIVAVIAIHTTSYWMTIGSVNPLLVSAAFTTTITHFAVPLFIMVSGLVLGLKYRGTFSLRTFYSKRFRSTIIPYLIFAVLYTIFLGYLFTSPSIKMALLNIAIGESALHLWFIILIIQFYLLYPVLLRLFEYFESRDRGLVLVIASLVIQTSWNVLILYPENWMPGGNVGQIKASILHNAFLTHVFYFIAGMYVSRHYRRWMDGIASFRFGILVIEASLLSGLVTVFLLPSVTTVTGLSLITAKTCKALILPALYLCMFALLFRAARALLRKSGALPSAFLSLGRYSYGIYLIHVFFLYALFFWLEDFGIHPDSWLYYPLHFCGVLILSYVSIRLISLVPGSSILIGPHRTKSTSNNAIDRS